MVDLTRLRAAAVAWNMVLLVVSDKKIWRYLFSLWLLLSCYSYVDVCLSYNFCVSIDFDVFASWDGAS